MRIFLQTAFSLFASSEVIPPTGKFTDSTGLERETYSIKKTLETDDFHFVVIGDWGGRPAPFYTSPLQVSGAVALMKYAKINKPEYVVSIGDHFYFNGIESVQDRRWERTFEEVYDSEEMMVPWYPAMGNHDWDKLPEDTEGDRLGNGWAQIEYSAHGTGRWTHPDVFFTTEYTTADGAVVKTIIIDTTVLTGVYSGGPPLPDRDDPRFNFNLNSCG
jgi:tartrate-resistant acid phosphatase type 5